MDDSDLGNRMKDYERRNQYYLQHKIPVILRLDMRAGHSFCRGFDKPFDPIFMEAMQETMRHLCQEISGVCLAYTQSDEITLVLQDYKQIETDAWFSYRTDKLCSITASSATLAFNRIFDRLYLEDLMNYDQEELPLFVLAHDRARKNGATFNCRCFNLPKEEVTNCLFWRQQDSVRNSIQSLAQANFPHKQLQGKSCNELQEMLFQMKGINWNDLETEKKRGSCCVKIEAEGRSRWVIDRDIPIFKGEKRQYVEKRVNFNMED